jgi:cell division protein FtsQ
MKIKTAVNAAWWRSYRQAIAWSLVMVLFVLFAGFAGRERSNIICSSVEIIIDGGEPVNGFVSESDVLEMLQSPERNPVGKKLSDINIAVLENRIRSNPYVAEAEVFSTIDGKVIFDIRQRLPLMRIINEFNEQFYIDSEGVFMPLSNKFTADVPVATHVPAVRMKHASLDLTTPPDSFSLLRHLFEISKYITQSDFWNAQTEQLHVNEQGDIELIPRIGDQVIVLGNSEKLEEKLSHLMHLYRQGFKARSWNDYSVINLKFSNQAVCTKK